MLRASWLRMQCEYLKYFVVSMYFFIVACNEEKKERCWNNEIDFVNIKLYYAIGFI